jgi:hypothetical protein
MNSDCDASGQLTPPQWNCFAVGQLLANALGASDLAAQGFAAELTDAFEVIPVVTGGELISRPVFTRLVLTTARKIDANRHTMANKPA